MELFRIEIPKHIRQIQLSARQRPQYFEWNGLSIKGKGTKVPVRFFKKGEQRSNIVIIEHLKDEYSIGAFNKAGKLITIIRDSTALPKSVFILKYRLCDKDNNPILCNPMKVNKPKIYLIKGQDIYSGNLREHVRGTIMDAIKNYYRKFVENSPVIDRYPVRIDCEIHDTINNPYDRRSKNSQIGQRWDVDNYAYPYLKAFPDIMVEMGKLKDDDRMHLTIPPSAIFVPIDNHEDRKLVFIISEDKRELINNNELYKNYHKTNNEVYHKDSYESEDTELVKDDEPFEDYGIIVENNAEQKEKVEKVKEILNWKESSALEVGLNKNKNEEI